MMIKTLQCRFWTLIIFSLISFSIFNLCSNKIKCKDENKFKEIIKNYDPERELAFKRLEIKYKYADTINNFFSSLNTEYIMNDSTFRYLILTFLEKKFLAVLKYNNDSTYFFTNNASCWGSDRTFLQYALNVYSRIEYKKDDTYETYINYFLDVVCIDSIIMEADKYPKSDTFLSKIHLKCMEKRKLGKTRCYENESWIKY